MLEISPGNREIIYRQGKALEKMGDFEAAIGCYDKILELDPGNVDAYNNKGFALSKLEKYQEAIDCYNKALGI